MSEIDLSLLQARLTEFVPQGRARLDAPYARLWSMCAA
jgi:hypothetical protein